MSQTKPLRMETEFKPMGDQPKAIQSIVDSVEAGEGVLSDRECRERNVGGEKLATVW